MTRLFYTDPLAAAWMAKHHGVRFEMPDGNPPGDYEALCLLTSLGQLRYTIHPDSLHLLEPLVRDAVEFDRWHWERHRNEEAKDYPYQAHYGSVSSHGGKSEWVSIISAGVGWDSVRKGERFALPFKIIQRNGLPFMWPESEAA